MCAGRQALWWLLPGVGAGLDRGEPVGAVVVGQAAADAGEVRVERRRVLVALVDVATAGVGLPDLDQLAPHRPAVAVQHPAGDHHPLADRLAAVLDGQVGLQRVDVAVAEDRRDTARRPPGRRAAGPWSGAAAGCCGRAGSRAAAGSPRGPRASWASAIAAISRVDVGLGWQAAARSRAATVRRRRAAAARYASTERKDVGTAMAGNTSTPGASVTSARSRCSARSTSDHRAAVADRARRAGGPADADRAPAGRRAGRAGAR